MRRPKESKPEEIELTDEPGMAERFERGLRKALSTPPKPRTSKNQRKNRKVTNRKEPL